MILEFFDRIFVKYFTDLEKSVLFKVLLVLSMALPFYIPISLLTQYFRVKY